MSDETPRLHIDSDWKAQAQAEKERLAEKESARHPAAAPGAPADADGSMDPNELPEANFRALIATLGSQAMMGLGAYTDPNTGGVMIDLPGAQFAIDLLGVIAEKTKGNLTPEENTELTEILDQLRQRFVQVANLVAAQMRREAQARMGGGMGGSMGSGMGADVAGSIGMSRPPTSPGGLVMPD